MNPGHRNSSRVSPAFFAALLAVVAVVALLLLRRRAAQLGLQLGELGRLRRQLLLRLAPGLAAVACVAALYYEQRSVPLLRLAVSAVFLQLLAICAARVAPLPSSKLE
jgi:hypothetical protein